MSSPTHFEFATATRIIFGAGRVRELGSVARTLGRRALVVTGRRPERAKRMTALLADSGVTSATFSVPGEPEVGTVETGVAQAKKSGCDLVVGFGGGSALDAGKAIAAMLTNEGELLDYLEVIGGNKPLAFPSAPFVAIPTTAGTGTEVTRNAVLASPVHRFKVSLRSPLMLPRVALVDPELTYALPPPLTASTGLDALTQLIEPFVCSLHNPMTDAVCREGIRRAARSLRFAIAEGQSAAAREDMALASLFGGLALANAGLGAAHGFAGPIGGMFPAPHGAVCAVLLPQVMAANLAALREREPASAALRRYDEIAQLLTGNGQAQASDAVEWVTRLVTDLRIPRLAAYGVKPSDLGELVAKSAQASSMKANPIALTEPELTQVLERAL